MQIIRAFRLAYNQLRYVQGGAKDGLDNEELVSL